MGWHGSCSLSHMGHVRKHSAVSPGRRARRLVGLLLWPTALLPGLAAAEDWNRNLRWSLDYSIDAQDVSGGRDGSGRLHFLGIDSHNTFRRDGRNAVTTIFQLYAAKTDGLAAFAPNKTE